MYSDAKITHYFLYRQGNTNKNGFPAVVRQDKGGALSKYRGLSRESTGSLDTYVNLSKIWHIPLFHVYLHPID